MDPLRGFETTGRRGHVALDVDMILKGQNPRKPVPVPQLKNLPTHPGNARAANFKIIR